MKSLPNFHDFYFSLTAQQREALVAKCDTTIAYAERMACGFRKPSLDMAVRLVRASGGKINLDSFVRTWEAKNGPLA